MYVDSDSEETSTEESSEEEEELDEEEEENSGKREGENLSPQSRHPLLQRTEEVSD